MIIKLLIAIIVKKHLESTEESIIAEHVVKYFAQIAVEIGFCYQVKSTNLSSKFSFNFTLSNIETFGYPDPVRTCILCLKRHGSLNWSRKGILFFLIR